MKNWLFLVLTFAILSACGKTEKGNSKIDAFFSAIGVKHWILKDARNVLSGFAAKEGCSCFFVEKRSEEECRVYVNNGVPISLKITETGAESNLLGIHNSATFHGERKGCTID